MTGHSPWPAVPTGHAAAGAPVLQQGPGAGAAPTVALPQRPQARAGKGPRSPGVLPMAGGGAGGHPLSPYLSRCLPETSPAWGASPWVPHRKGGGTVHHSSLLQDPAGPGLAGLPTGSEHWPLGGMGVHLQKGQEALGGLCWLSLLPLPALTHPACSWTVPPTSGLSHSSLGRGKR